MALEIEAPSRMHFGFLDLTGDQFHKYGGIGIAINEPKAELTIATSNTLKVKGEDQKRVRKITRDILEKLNVPGTSLHVKKTIPSHRGLGSGTSLTLAILSGLIRLYDLKLDLEKTAYRLGRGKRSGVGTKIAKKGGFVIELGHSTHGEKKPTLLQQKFPKNWFFTLITPKYQGLHGKKEKKAFEQEVNQPKKLAGEVCRTTLMSLVPALKKQNLNEFGKALTKIQKNIGKTFKKTQDGIYAYNEAKKIFNKIKNIPEVKAYGQSSWGPTIFFLTREKQERKIKNKIDKIKPELEKEIEIKTTTPNNQGIKIKK
ncbi:MAG: putative sugar kinase [Candidatus Methanohalarchaeum thermophilum]|uniref:Beta-ribofuranosylaminobenzene 5'-phosphate synthase n=1 Tax=Methanohalarchaeum thermophilum TaxID=1903181 RepID=A0A1Q6DU01_METT1|nr:MAG: putative sugar kinase [Candidatus Methanohalarchaeum thermophilum]